jgi:hypothetical protein
MQSMLRDDVRRRGGSLRVRLGRAQMGSSAYACRVSEERARIEAAIAEAGDYVGRMPPTAGARELSTRLESFRRVVQSWGPVSRPTRQQLDAMLEQVAEVRRLAISTAPTLRRKAQP